MIRIAEEKDYQKLIKVYKKVFTTHGIFNKPEKEILDYMKKAGVWLVAEDEEITGGLLIASKEASPGWKIHRFKHIAVDHESRGKRFGEGLLQSAEKIARKGKIEIHTACTDGNACPFYGKYGYEKEGELKNHYRKEESTIIMGKVIG